MILGMRTVMYEYSFYDTVVLGVSIFSTLLVALIRINYFGTFVIIAARQTRITYSKVIL